tara:strand:- start:103 stop:1005 length:903 start_codon:yes stop_codon:yes gene_type:complete
MQNKISITTTCSDKYFHLFEELVDSIRRFSDSDTVDINVVKRGLSLENLKKLGNKIQNVSEIKSFVKNDSNPIDHAQLFIKDYFPGYEKYVFLDSDIWLNSWPVFKLLIDSTAKGKFAVSSMADRHQDNIMRVDWILRNFGLVKPQNLKHSIKLGVSSDIIKKISLKPHLNSGVTALDIKSTFWDYWIKNYEYLNGLGKKNYCNSQLSLNYAVYVDEAPTNILPHYVNCMPNLRNVLFDTDKNIFREKYMPHDEIGFMHLAGGAKTKEDGIDFRFENKKIKIETLKGEIFYRSYRYKNPE